MASIARPGRALSPAGASARSAGASRPAVGVAALFVVLVPLALDPWGFQQRLPVSWLVVLALVPVGLGIAVRAAGSVRWAAVQRWWVALLGALALAAAFGVAPLTSVIGSPARRLGLVGWVALALACWWGVNLGQLPGAPLLVARALLAGSVPVSVIGLVERGERFFVFGSGPNLVRTASTLRNAAFLGAYLALVVPVAVALALGERHRGWRIAYGGAGAVALLTLVFSQTRAAWIGTVVGVAVVAAPRLAHAGGRRRVLVTGVVTVAAVGALAIAPVRDRALSVAAVSGGSNGARAQLWTRGVVAIADRPLLGYGPDATLLAYPQVIDARFEREVTRETLPDRAHTLVLDLALWGGIPTVVAGIGLLLAVGRRLRGSLDGPVRLGLAAALVAYTVQLLFSFPLADLDALVWLLAGVLLAPFASPVRLPAGFSRGVTACCVLLGLGAGLWQVRDVVADRQLRAAIDRDAQGDVAGAERAFLAATETASERAQYWQALGRFERFVAEASKDSGRFERSVVAHRRALSLVPGDTSYELDLADTRLSQAEAGAGDYATAENSVRAVIAHDPHSARAWFLLGTAVADQGKLDEAFGAWTTAAELAPTFSGPSRNLARLADRRGDVATAVARYHDVLAIEGTDTEASGYLAAHP